MELEVLKFVPFRSLVDQSFWFKLCENKLNVDKLNDDPKSIYGFYYISNNNKCLIEVDCTAFNKNFEPPKNCFPVSGTLYNKNTIEDFKTCDKATLIHAEGSKLLNDIKSGSILDNIHLLFRFFILSYADLKTHTHYYWFGFPICLEPVIYVNFTKQRKLKEKILNYKNLEDLYHSTELKNRIFFALEEANRTNEHNFISAKDAIVQLNSQNGLLSNIYFCFSDASVYKKPCWILRLYVILIYFKCPQERGRVIKFIGFREKAGSIGNSLIWDVVIPNEELNFDNLNYVGWECNSNGKLCPQRVSMANSMDPIKLAQNSIDLNIKLMKWRMVPDLDLTCIFKTKCLLFGAGTLGCSVARSLLAWGFKNISFVDNGVISFSNPIRQSLFRYQDALTGLVYKAMTAAYRLKEINPQAITNGFVIEIPMPGYPIADTVRESTLYDIKRIEELVQQHDVLFLLTDSRESRWLPTVLGAFHNKVVINVALGFDTYLVMRHGSRRKVDNLLHMKEKSCVSGENLGCYFCNDIVAPGNSLKNRTLDQKCTVTRPSVANIAASYAVELLVNLLQHPQRELAPAYFNIKTKDVTSIPEDMLGILPHSIRGSVANFQNILPVTSKFPQCIACSEYILDAFGRSQENFLFDVFNSPIHLEELTGIVNLKKINNEAIECEDDFCLSD